MGFNSVFKGLISTAFKVSHFVTERCRFFFWPRKYRVLYNQQHVTALQHLHTAAISYGRSVSVPLEKHDREI